MDKPFSPCIKSKSGYEINNKYEKHKSIQECSPCVLYDNESGDEDDKGIMECKSGSLFRQSNTNSSIAII
jgi:hypothetical protein